MTQLPFSADDVARVRFVISPMWQVGPGFRLLMGSADNQVHRRWLTQIRPRLTAAGLDRGLLAALIPRAGFVADLLNPTTSTQAPTLADELAAIADTPEKTVRRDIERLRETATTGSSARLLRLEADPDTVLTRVSEEIDVFWRIALAPYWDRINAVLEADVFNRARQLAQYGVGHLLNDLHPLVGWQGERLHLPRRRPVPPRGPDAPGGLILLPSVFKGPGLATRHVAEDPWQVAYRARGHGQIWERRTTDETQALANVVGRARAALLAELAAPATTSDLAERTGMSMSGVSQNLIALRNAGFVSAHRSGRHVLYARTAISDALFKP